VALRLVPARPGTPLAKEWDQATWDEAIKPADGTDQATADDSGRIAARVRIPADAPAGHYRLVAADLPTHAATPRAITPARQPVIITAPRSTAASTSPPHS
jgi:hypothetical protein